MRTALLVAASVVLTALVGCAAGSSDEASDASNDALTASASASCTPAAYNAGLAHYKNAVAGAKDNAAKKMCDTDQAGGDLGGTVSFITSESAAAVKSCAQFQNVIASSVYAQPIRTALAGNLALASLTGKLTKDFTGLDAALAGTTMYGPGAGIVANESLIAFSANGKAVISKLDTEQDPALWVKQNATWSTSTAAGKTTLTLTTIDASTTYTVTVDPQDGVTIVFTPATGDTFVSLPSECEA